MNKTVMAGLAMVLSGTLTGGSLAEPPKRLPNILLILADDFGVGSINAYGAPKKLVRTPSLDELAREGMRFTNADTPASVCSPTRYALLTGRYAWRGKLAFGVVGVDDPLVIETGRETLAACLKKRGYATAQIGKWHLGYGDKTPVQFTGKLSPGPNDIGFDYHFGLPQNLDDKLRVWIENDRIYGLRSTNESLYAKSFYGAQYRGFDAPQCIRETANAFLTDKAIEWIRTTHRQQPDRPFFLYFAPPATHHPIVPSEEMRGASHCGAYGDFIQDLDLSVGRVVRALEYEGIAGETLILFSADNGGDIPENDPTRPECQARAAGLLANGANRGDKHTIWEGGSRVPLIVRWDGMVRPGTVSAAMVNLVDVFATLAEAAGGEVPPADRAAEDSVSFLPTLLGRPQPPRIPMVTCNAGGLQAIRDGKWKYMDGQFPESAPPGLRKSYQGEAEPALYDLETDPGEQTNLIARHPEIAQKLQAMLDEYRRKGSSR